MESLLILSPAAREGFMQRLVTSIARTPHVAQGSPSEGLLAYQKVPLRSKYPDAVALSVVSIWSAENAPSQIHEPM